MVVQKKKKPVTGQSSGKLTFRAEKTVEVMDKKPVFEVFRKSGDGLETSVCKIYPDSLTNPTRFYNTNAGLVYDSNSDLIREVPGMAVAAVKQRIAELYGSSPQAPPQPPKPAEAPKPATAQAKPYVPPQYQKPVAKPVGPPAKPVSPSVNYQAECESLEAELEEKAEEIADLKSKLEADEKTGAGISQADLDARLDEQKESLSGNYDRRITTIHLKHVVIASGKAIREHNNKVEIMVYSKAKDKKLWVHQRKDGRFAYFNDEGKDVIYTPEKMPAKDIKDYLVAAEQVIGSQKKIKSLEKKLAKGNVEDLEEKLKLSETHCNDLIEEKRNEPSRHARRWLAAAASSAPVSMVIGYLVEKAHLIENVINNYLPSASWLADYADKLHQIDNSNAVGGLIGGLIGMYAAYKIWMAGEKAVETKAEQESAIYADYEAWMARKPAPSPKAKPEEIPVVRMDSPAPHKPATKVYKSRDSKVIDEEFE